MVIEFAVIRNPTRAVGVRHRLPSRRCQIDDGEAAMTESHRSLNKKILVIRPAMREGARHPQEQLTVNWPLWFCVIKDPGDSAHLLNKKAGLRFILPLR
jgi:hypothetical protein